MPGLFASGSNSFKHQIEQALKRKLGEVKLERPKNEKQTMKIVLVCHRLLFY